MMPLGDHFSASQVCGVDGAKAPSGVELGNRGSSRGRNWLNFVRTHIHLGRQIVIRAAQGVCGGDATIDVRLEEDSLRTWVSVAGALPICRAIANCKGAKESDQETCKDARI
jgi:hypothetical protein